MCMSKLRFKKSIKLKPRTEYDEQVAVANYLRIKYPEVNFTISPEGMKLPIGVAMKMKRQGYKRGTPDLLILKPNKRYHGLFIEMKREKNGVVSDSQKEFINNLLRDGYYAVVCNGCYEAYKEIDNYMKDN